MIVTMEPNRGPVLPDPLLTPSDLSKLNPNVDVQKELGYVFEAITMTRHGLKGRVPLIGFCGAPWTLMAYMVEGGGSKTFEKSKSWLYRFPEGSRDLLKRIADVCADLLIGQVLAGAQVCLLSPQRYYHFWRTARVQTRADAYASVDAAGLRQLGGRTYTIPVHDLRSPPSPTHLS